MRLFYKIIVFLFKLSQLTVNCEEKGYRTFAGQKADIREVPYTVYTTLGCTGALIRPQWVLSAAHCFVDYDWRCIKIGLGSADTTNTSYIIGLEKVYIHPQFTPDDDLIRNAHFDVAVIKLAVAAELSEYVQLIEIDETAWPSWADKRECRLAGFGRNIHQFESTNLHISTFQFKRGCSCVIGKNIICTVTANDGDDSPCYGDEGSIVVCNGKGIAVMSQQVPSRHCDSQQGSWQVCGSKAFLFKLSLFTVKCEEKGYRTYAGEEVDIRDVPHTVHTSTGCGGALIRPQWVLSAAHCFADHDWECIRIGLGSTDRRKTSYHIAIEKVYLQPQFRKKQHVITRAHFDIAVIKLKVPALLSPHVRLIELEETPWPNGIKERNCLFAGFGRNVHHFKHTNLHISKFSFTQGCNCVETSNIICTTTANDGDDSPCYGDEGGIVVCDYKGVAIMSKQVPSRYCDYKNGTSRICSSKGAITLFTYIYLHTEWIKDVIETEPNTYLRSKACELTMKDIRYYGKVIISIPVFALLIFL